MSEQSVKKQNYGHLANQIKQWGREFGFADVRITKAELPAEAGLRLQQWLDEGMHGEMSYMERHGLLRVRPQELVPGTLSIVSVRMHYWPAESADAHQVLADGESAYISRYALGRDYHKVIRNRLQKLAERIKSEIGEFGFRVFTDSAPVAEVALAAQAGLGWKGKHTLLINKQQGSLYFLGEIFTDLPLPADESEDGHCGRCTRCIDVCPTQAIVAPYQVDARRCVSYLTIELQGLIPAEMRSMMGNRIYGCDDCQLVCPWNRFAQMAGEEDFKVRHGLDSVTLLTLAGWSEQEFASKMAGSPIYRIGYGKWLSNIVIALGNGPASEASMQCVQALRAHEDARVSEAATWALDQLQQRLAASAAANLD